MSSRTFSKRAIRKSKDYFTSLYNRNKKFLIVSAAFYFLALIIGLFIGYFLPGNIEPFLLSIIRTDRMFVRQNGISTLSILSHNMYSVFLTYIGGIVGIITAAIIFLNGFIYGFFFRISILQPPYCKFHRKCNSRVLPYLHHTTRYIRNYRFYYFGRCRIQTHNSNY